MTSSKKRAKNLPSHIDHLRGTSQLAIAATQAICDLVESMHETIASGPNVLGRPLRKPTRAINTVIYGGVRLVTRIVGEKIDGALGQLAQTLGPSERTYRSPQKDAVLSVLNGVLGDYLQETGNPLAIQMQLRETLPKAGRKLLVLVHGSCLNDRQWLRHEHNHGTALFRDLEYTPVYLHYNTGLHTSTNGQLFATLLEELVTRWPAPLDEIVILAHSMGGLVSRSAYHSAEEHDYQWRKKLKSMIFLGTPHQGAPLERIGNWIDHLLVINRYSAPLARLGKIRSAGVTDMRYGNALEEHWHGRDRFTLGADTRTPLPLPAKVDCYTIAATKGNEGNKKLPSDGIVPVDSALGRNKIAKLNLDFPETHQWIGYGMNHLDLLSRPEVYAKIRQWLQ